jgi:iron uptake system component EfeO
MRLIRYGSIFAFLVFLLAACGQAATPGAGSKASSSAPLSVNVFDNYFEPQSLSSAPRQEVEVTFTNKGSNVHIVEILGLTAETTLQPGGKVTFKITPQERSYKMYDELYVSKGMVGAFVGSKDSQPSAQPTAIATAEPTIQNAINAYKAYVQDQADKLLSTSQDFVDAINKGDLAKAKALYGTARVGYERIEPIAGNLGDLDPKLDAREGDLPVAQWTGFHRIEKALWIDGTTKGLDTYTQQLIADLTTLDKGVAPLKLSATDVMDGSVELLNEASHSKIQGEEDRYSHTDLYDLAANVEGSQAAFIVFQDFLTKNNPAQYKDIQAKFQQIESVLKPFRTADGFVDYSTLTDSDKKNIAGTIDSVAEALSKVAANLPQN